MKSFSLTLALVLLLTLTLGACGAAPSPPPAASDAPSPSPSPSMAAEPIPSQAPAQTPSPESTPEPSPAPVYDAAAYEAAREALRKEYRIVCITEPGEFREEEHPEIPHYSITNYLYNQYDGLQLYWGEYDFDSNGVPELVMAVGEDGLCQPIGIYAFDGSRFHYLCKEQALGERASVSFGEQSCFTVCASGGAASGGVLVYRIGADGYSTEILEWYEYQLQEDGQVEITNHIGAMTPETFDPESLFAPFDVPIAYTLVP